MCKKCNQDRPEDDTQDSQLGLRKTRGAGKSRRFDYIDQKSDNDYDASPYEGFRKRGASMRKPDQRRTTARSRGFDDLEDDYNASPYEGFRKRGASMRKPDQRRTTAKSSGFDDLEDGLLTAKSRRAKEDEDDEVLPYEGVRKHVVSRRATPSQRRFTAARNQ